MNKEQKSESIQEIKNLLDSSDAIYLTDFSGLTVEEVNDALCRAEGEIRY